MLRVNNGPLDVPLADGYTFCMCEGQKILKICKLQLLIVTDISSRRGAFDSDRKSEMVSMYRGCKHGL